LGKGDIAMLEFCCHFFLDELQSIVDELYFFSNAEFEQELIIAIRFLLAFSLTLSV
jgi:hypothetical protein